MTSLSETSMLAGSSGVTSGYTIDQSIRLSGADTTGLNITPSGAGNTDKWTFSCWVKRGKLGQSGGGGSPVSYTHLTLPTTPYV